MGHPTAAPIRVVTIEDDARFQASLEFLLRHSDGFALAASFSAPADAIAALAAFGTSGGPGSGDRGAVDPGAGDRPADRAGWDIVLMDIELPGMSGIECTRRIKEVLPDVPVIVLTVFEDRATLVEAICAGADGYLLKKTPSDQLLEQLRAVVDGGSPLSAGVARSVVEIVRKLDYAAARTGPAPDAVTFTPREREVLACLVQGMSYKAVGRVLDISIDTVRSHIRSIYRKLQVNTVAEAVSRVLRDGLV
jgi:DNA-binding NarL/FixJ family response regulator